MELLQGVEDRGCPADYLLARIRGRRARLIEDWQPFLSAPLPPQYLEEAVWEMLLRELAWVYWRMNGNLRGVFAPLFQYLELRTLFLCLRNKAASEQQKVESLLSLSLLSRKLKGRLVKSEDVLAAVAGVEEVLAAADRSFKGLGKIYAQEGPRAFEQAVTDRFLRHTVGAGPHPALGRFFGYLIDSRNVLGLYKRLRWGVKAPPAFLAGGRLREVLLRQVWEQKDLSGLDRLISRLTGTGPKVGAKVEQALLTGMTRMLRRGGRDPLQVGVILDYLWRCQVEARNLSLLLSVEEGAREVLEGELIR